MTLGSIHHIAIKATDLPAAKAFYTELLGFPIVGTVPGSETVFINVGGTTIELSGGGTGEIQPVACGMLHLAFEVDDVDAAYQELSAKGIQFHIVPRTVGDIRLAFFKGPDGIDLELFHSPTLTWK